MLPLFGRLALCTAENGTKAERLQLLSELFRSLRDTDILTEEEVSKIASMLYELLEKHQEEINKLE